ncbi:hypothetical protein GGR56DRAFT_317091 [Xylariaceae sp. FL0804]|nr:hypothetical protein GGR56DRAFT_317091 [Xylariaceae sp. FL0804]
MPHRVADFFRLPNDSVKGTKQRRSSPPARPSRNSSYCSSADEAPPSLLLSAQAPAPAPKMSDAGRKKEKEGNKERKEHHRLSLPALGLGVNKTHKDQSHQPGASLDWKIESPPAVMYGNAEESTGALVSGQLLLSATEELDLESFEARLEIHVTQKKPFNSHCHNCAHQKTELKKWSFLAEPTVLSKRTHEFPFSVLLEGHLPATTDNSVMSITYDFTAEAKRRGGTTLRLFRNINVRRSLLVPELPHHSIRIFPPTNITASLHYDQIIHPIGSNKVSLRLEGIVKQNAEAKTVEYWKLKRLSWKLEENLTTVAPACDKHSPKSAETGQPTKKGQKRTDARTIAHADTHGGWKSDNSSTGSIEMEIDYQCAPQAKAVCDVNSGDGTSIGHQLVVEMVVVQEYAPQAQPRHITPTGVARILRMHFAVQVTERAGLGVSWDNEAPPIYQDVPPSPPDYTPAESSSSRASTPYESMDSLILMGQRLNLTERGQSPAYEE